MRSTPAGPAVGPSYVSVMLDAQRVTLALLTDSPSSLLPAAAAAPSSSLGGSFLQQAEEAVRVLVDDVNVFVEVGATGENTGLVSVVETAVAARGSAVMAVEIQDFSNFLRVPLLSQGVMECDVIVSSRSANTGRGKKNDGDSGDEFLLSPFRPVASAAVGVRGAVISLSATALQCVDRCLGELFGGGESTREAFKNDVPSASSPTPPPTPAPSPPQSLQRRKGYVVTNHTDRALWFGQVSTTEAEVLSPGTSTSYRWRTMPAPPVAAKGMRGGGRSRLILMIRLALHDNVHASPRSPGGRASGGGFGAWTEPFPADHAGTYMVSSVTMICLQLASILAALQTCCVSLRACYRVPLL